MPLGTSGFEGSRFGWTVGAGVEKALTPAWSVKLEYDYASFGAASVATPASFVQVLPPLNLYAPTAGGISSVSQNMHSVKMGVNLKLGEDPNARWEAAADYRLRG